ncbi:unnamed protein product [Arctia plantaginis]|uniref:Mpv17-like protein 2 n=1 Tax=Arctia plantaginis TaxID=874455 RepID=A0A8S1A453_ARCPL|nr:unnamed protein product [Arctia plantaginis]
MTLGDLVEQEFEFRSNKIPKRYDWTRAGHMFIVGILLGSFYHFYYTTLERCIPKVTMKTTVIKILLDQALVSPIALFGFYCGVDYLDGKPFEACKAELNKKFLKTFTIDCMYWPPIQFINFYFLPISYRVLYINVTTMIYYIFLSYMKHYDAKK